MKEWLSEVIGLPDGPRNQEDTAQIAVLPVGVIAAFIQTAPTDRQEDLFQQYVSAVRLEALLTYEQIAGWVLRDVPSEEDLQNQLRPLIFSPPLLAPPAE